VVLTEREAPKPTLGVGNFVGLGDRGGLDTSESSYVEGSGPRRQLDTAQHPPVREPPFVPGPETTWAAAQSVEEGPRILHAQIIDYGHDDGRRLHRFGQPNGC